MFCPKCSELELEPVTNDKLEYLACVNGCEGVWVERPVLEKYWGKKKFKQQESLLVAVKQRAFEDKDKDNHKNEDAPEKAKAKSAPVAEKGAEKGEKAKAKVAAFDDDEEEDEDFDDDEEDDDSEYDDEEEKEKVKVKDDYEEYAAEEEEEEVEEEQEDEEIEEVVFGDKRGLDRTLISEDGEFEDPATETSETYAETPDMMEEEDDEPLAIEEDENLFWTSPVSGNPMKRFNYVVNERLKCSVGNCTESDSYWVDGSEEVLLFEEEKKQGGPKTFSALLAYDRPEEEIIEDEEEDEEDI